MRRRDPLVPLDIDLRVGPAALVDAPVPVDAAIDMELYGGGGGAAAVPLADADADDSGGEQDTTARRQERRRLHADAALSRIAAAAGMDIPDPAPLLAARPVGSRKRDFFGTGPGQKPAEPAFVPRPRMEPSAFSSTRAAPGFAGAASKPLTIPIARRPTPASVKEAEAEVRDLGISPSEFM